MKQEKATSRPGADAETRRLARVTRWQRQGAITWPGVSDPISFIDMSEWPDRASSTGQTGSDARGDAATRDTRTESATPGQCLLYLSDNQLALNELRAEFAGKLTLIYLDPPFLTGKQHFWLRRSPSAPSPRPRKSVPAFDDRWSSLGEYLDALGRRLESCRALLAAHGSLVLHVDPKTSHYCKVLCDQLFGPECFASEIIWRYRRWPSRTANFQRVHDVLLRYVKDPDTKPRFCQLYEPLAVSTRATWGTRRQRAVVGRDGRRMRSSTTDSESPGVPLGDVWDVGILAPLSKERTGYPTQKPEALLERIVCSLSSPGDWVLDPYAGSGTTLSVACRLARNVIGIDSSPQAIELTAERLRATGAAPRLCRLPARETPGLSATLGRRGRKREAAA